MATYVEVDEPRFARWLFQSISASWIWLVVRLYLGYEWLQAGWEKVSGSDEAWKFTFTDSSWLKTGAALRGFIEHAALPQAAQGPHSAVVGTRLTSAVFVGTTLTTQRAPATSGNASWSANLTRPCFGSS